ncbi:short-chain fatty acyl-CoA regulator family protein [Paracoccus sp. PS-1]|uniref:helix-turn-helix transcriptional regulator n=1 Tax=unclassified Paracoccus (in: a-proteobacteria) TaxID=2688777 RepID=UPI00048DBD42|nr:MULTISPECIES: helix-turn-helix transcriptional regulator [unclassified Paracoccus (in: a-proteobacteria)]MDQ7261662.1 short-chain fatty acyl-CoA regulator family protein [Paracoccus sp. PS1]
MPRSLPRHPVARPLIGTRIRERRLSLGRRQTEVARRAEISAAYLNLIEHNRRPVGEELLSRLAEALEIDATELASDREEALIGTLREAAARAAEQPGAPVELDQIAEFAARFPGWASALAGTTRRADALERRLVALSDRMTRDPYLLATLHEVQSAVTALRSTASILAETPEIEPEWRDRFHANLDTDSQRLSRTAQSLVAYLDSFEDEAVPMSPQEEVEAWIAAGQPEPGEAAELVSDAARVIAQELLAAQARDRAALPNAALAAVVDEAGEAACDPALVAARLGRPLDLVLRRLGMLRPGPWAQAGLIVCDGSGAPLFRQAAPGFELPRPGEGCALWPLFEALAQPQLPVARLIETTNGNRFAAWAVAERLLPMGFDGPALSRAQMLVRPAASRDPRPALGVGPACRICPRPACAARHEPSILGPV